MDHFLGWIFIKLVAMLALLCILILGKCNLGLSITPKQWSMEQLTPNETNYNYKIYTLPSELDPVANID